MRACNVAYVQLAAGRAGGRIGLHAAEGVQLYVQLHVCSRWGGAGLHAVGGQAGGSARTHAGQGGRQGGLGGVGGRGEGRQAVLGGSCVFILTAIRQTHLELNIAKGIGAPTEGRRVRAF